MTHSESNNPESSEPTNAGAGPRSSTGGTLRPVGPEESPSTAAVLAVADATGRDPLDLSPPLHAFVDPDALDALAADDHRVAFDAYGRRVVVEDDVVEVRRPMVDPTAGADGDV